MQGPALHGRGAPDDPDRSSETTAELYSRGHDRATCPARDRLRPCRRPRWRRGSHTAQGVYRTQESFNGERVARIVALGIWILGFGSWGFLVPVRGFEPRFDG